MRNPRLASIYAKSLIELAEKQSSLETAYADIQYIWQALRVSREFEQVLESPIIKSDKKTAILKAILQPNVSPLTWAFLTLVLNKKREAYLKQIAEAFVQQYNYVKGIHEVSLTTAVAINDKVLGQIMERVKSERNFAHIKLSTKVDPALIGGFVLEFDNNLVDASVSHQLRALTRAFQDNSYIAGLH